jgi:3-dehydroquinate synthase
MLPDNILFSDEPADALKKFIQSRKYSRVAILADENTTRHCLSVITKSIEEAVHIEVRSGEEQKNLSTCTLIWEEMTEAALDRHSALIVLGGGVLGDMGGFCAATYKRGIDFILVPTTLLSQVDASIGGKLGVDFQSFKNHIGVFRDPALTLLHSGFLKTLPASELRSGFAEVIKHCLISDAAMWNTIRQRPLAAQDWPTLLRHSVEFKARVTSEDPTEKGLRKILNAGHTVGHAVESHLLASGKRVLHGEAIAIGLVAEAFIASQRKYLTADELSTIQHYIISIFGKTEFTDEQIDGASKLALQDKKNRDNKILCALLNGIGQCKWDEEISLAELQESLRYYRSVQM